MRAIAITLALAVAGIINAQSIASVREKISNGEYQEAIEMINHLPDKDLKTPQPYILAAQCYEAMGNIADAEKNYNKAVAKGSNIAYMELARLAIRQYHLDKADELLEKYRKGLKKGRKTSPDESGEVQELLDKTRNLINRVEEIEVFDSINVPAEDFFKHYKLSPASGILLPPSILPREFAKADPTVVFLPESRGEMIWSAPDDCLNYRLVHSLALYGNQWDTPEPLGDNLSTGGDCNYPFLMPDGITLYYAQDGEGSLGGYDIYVSRRDGNDFLQPQNLGMPYNSPYNDYMLAIDENTGVGWWASDRLGIDGMVTIYMFKPNEVRRNINVDDPHLSDKAMLRDISLTWKPGTDYTDLKESLRNISGPGMQLKAQCRFVMPDGRIISRIEQLTDPDARRAMRQYIELENDFNQAAVRLEELRARYAKGDTSVGPEILSQEKNQERDRVTLRQLANEVISYETAQ